jgi:hypothetical protein
MCTLVHFGDNIMPQKENIMNCPEILKGNKKKQSREGLSSGSSGRAPA